ncbi:MAG: hypothetical protein HDP34_02265 [Clostridia bacterium]|nr:hypothetical protein [Clostridia bacterium]
MKEKLLKNLMDIRSYISMRGLYLDLLEDSEFKLIHHCCIIGDIAYTSPYENMIKALDVLERLVKRRANLKEEVEHINSEVKRLSQFLDYKYWELERVRKMYALIEKGKAKTLQQAIELTE